MSRLKAVMAVGAGALLLLASSTNSRAEEIEHKFRIAFGVGGYSITDQQHSTSANVRVLLDANAQPFSFIQDPRNDSAAFSDFGLEPQYGTEISASYGINRVWYVEGSVGYRRGNVGNVEVQAMFNGVPTTSEQPFNFAIYNLNAGSITQVPIQLTTGVRFRPKASFNPFLCIGVGYSFNSFSPSSELDNLSQSLDQSTGAFRAVSENGGGFGPPGPTVNLSGITVDAASAPEWHFGGGFEYTFARRWSVFLDARYTVYSGSFKMTVNGSNELGISVPSDQRYVTDPDALGPFGAVDIQQGGLIDGGSFVPAPGFPDANCAVSQANCVFTGPPDGVKDKGLYYVHAGNVRYDAASYQIGFKFTF